MRQQSNEAPRMNKHTCLVRPSLIYHSLSAKLIELHPEWAEGAILLSPASGVAEMGGAMRGWENEDILLNTKMLAMIAERLPRLSVTKEGAESEG